jgi:cardiolipin synthase (CMP-forming)
MLSLPNLLTLSRILAVPILVFLLWRPAPLDYAITFVLYCIVGITDYFDGYLARAWGSISRLGQFLDPIADKIMVAAVLIMLISSRKANPVPEIAGLHIIPALVILLREIIVSGLREFLAELRVSVPVSARQMEDDISNGRAWSLDSRRCTARLPLGSRGWDRLAMGCCRADARDGL